MSGIAKVFVVINLVFSVLVLGSVGALLVEGSDFRKDLTDLQATLDTTQGKLDQEQSAHLALKKSYESDKRTDNDQIEDLRKSVSDKDDEIATLRRDKDQLRGAVDGINAKLGDFQENIDNLTNRNSQITDQLTAAQSTERDATGRQKQAEDELAAAQSQLASATDQISSLEAQMGDLANTIEQNEMILAAVQARGFPLSDITAQEAIDAVVQVVEYDPAKGSGFVVLSKGEQDDVKLGYRFHISRDFEYIGDVVVDELHPDNCVARIEFKAPNAEFRPQDIATTQL